MAFIRSLASTIFTHRRQGFIQGMALAVGFCLLALPAKAAPPEAEAGNLRIIALVNDEPITEFDVIANIKYQLLLAGKIKDGENVKSDAANAMGAATLRNLIQNKLILQELKRRQIVVDDSEVTDSIADFEEANHLKAGTVLGVLDRNNLPRRIVFDQERAQIGWPRAVSRRIQAASRVSDSDIDAALDDMKANKGKVEYLLSEITIVKKSDESEDDARERAAHVLKRLTQSADFERLARGFSDSPSSNEGGDLGWVRQDRIDPNISKILANLSKNAVSGVIETKTGLIIVKWRDKRENKNEGTELTRDQLHNQIFMQRLNSEGRRYLHELQLGAIIEVKQG